MAENSKIYYGGGIGFAGSLDIQAIGVVADSRLMVKDRTGLTELQTAKRVYDGMLVYCESDQTYHKCRVVWDADKNITSCTWTEVVIKSESELRDLITASTTAAMEFKGAAASLPESGVKGDMYKVSAEISVSAELDAEGNGFTAKVGDSIVYDGSKWFLIPTGDDIEDTWRPITVGDASIGGIGDGNALDFAAGSLLDVAIDDAGSIKYSHEAVAAPSNTNAEGDAKVREYITSLETDGFGHITGFKTNIETVADTSYDFEGTTVDSNVSFSIQKKVDGEDVDAAEVIKIDAYTQEEVDAAIKEVQDAVDVIEGKPAMDITADQISAWDGEVGVKAIVDANKATWDLAGTAVQSSDFEAFEEVNTKAIEDAAKAGTDAAAAVAGDLAEYVEAHKDDYTNEQINTAISTATGNLGSMSTKDAADYLTKTEVEDALDTKLDANGWVSNDTQNGWKISNETDRASIRCDMINIEADQPNGSTLGTSIKSDGITVYDDYGLDYDRLIIKPGHIEREQGDTHSDEGLAGRSIRYDLPLIGGTIALTSDVATAKQEAIDAAKEYANGLDHEDTTYTFAASENALEFTITPDGKGEAQTVKLVAPTVDTGIMEVAAGNDIVVTPGENGKVTVAHETFTTGEYAKDPETSDKTGDQYFFTGVTVDNGHVTGANVKSLASVLEAMTFIFDGGTSGAEA